MVNRFPLRPRRRSPLRRGHVADADDQGTPYRLGNIDQQEHAAAGHPVRRAGIARGLRTNRLRRRGLFGQLLGMRHRTDNKKRGVTLLFFVSIALLEPYQDVLIKVDP